MKPRDRWLNAVQKKGSLLCAGYDPTGFSAELPSCTLPGKDDSLNSGLQYIEEIAPFAAAVKFNPQFFLQDTESIRRLSSYAQEQGLLVIHDRKLADIGATNFAGIYGTKALGGDFVTFAPYAGNIEQAAKQAARLNVGSISICLMSNPEFINEKHKLVPLQNPHLYSAADVYRLTIDGKETYYTYQYIHAACVAKECGLDAIVIGAPSAANTTNEAQVSKAIQYAGKNMLILVPGVGTQGGDPTLILKHAPHGNVLVNVGSDLFHRPPNSRRAMAKQYMDQFNGAL